MSTPRLPNHTLTKQENSWSSLHVGINTFLYSTTTIPTPSTPTFSKPTSPGYHYNLDDLPQTPTPSWFRPHSPPPWQWVLPHHAKIIPQIQCWLPTSPPYTHRHNAAERVICTFKNHLCDGLAYCDPNFPSQEWDCFIPQSVITLNLLWPSCTNPSLFTHAAITRNFDFNATPIAPPRTKVLVYESSSTRPSFSTHAVNWWYIRPSLHYYCCYHWYIQSTASTRHADKVELLPNQFDFSRITNSTYLRQTAEEIISILSKKSHLFAPLTIFGPPYTQRLLTDCMYPATCCPNTTYTTNTPSPKYW